MNCQRCRVPVSSLAPLCPACGADPVLGADWLATSALALDARGDVVLPRSERPEAATMFELETEFLYHASGIAAAEAASADALLRWQLACAETACDEAARSPLDEALSSATEEALARIAASQAAFQGVAESIRRSIESGEPPAEAFERYYCPTVWAFREYAAYLEELSTSELRDVLRRRSLVLLSRRGFVNETTFAADDASFALTFDSLALTPLPADDSDAVHWLTDNFGGHEGSFGELALALVPAAWRGWQDMAISPTAGLAVFVKPDPLAGVACSDADWEGDRAAACAHYAAWLGSDGTGADSVRPATICALPAVRCQLTLADDNGSDYLVDHAWVKAPRHLYYVFAWAPVQRPELVQAVHNACAGFAPAGCAAARDAGPASAGAAGEPVMGPSATPADMIRRATGEEPS